MICPACLAMMLSVPENSGVLFVFLALSCAPDVGLRDTVTEIVEVPYNAGTVEHVVITEEFVVEEFEVRSGPVPVDLLMVLDTSCSMRAKLESAGEELHDVVAEMDGVTTDWRLNVTASSPGSSSLLDLVSTDPDRYGKALAFSPSANGQEAGLASAHAWVSSRLGWPRQGADLWVLMVSDEEDQSDLGGMTWPEYRDAWWSVFDGLAVAPSLVEYVASVRPEESERYQEIVGDGWTSIDAETWSAPLYDLTAQQTVQTDWQLQADPVVDSIRVYLDGRPYPEWSYNPNTNTLIVEPDATGYLVVWYLTRSI